MKYIYSIVTFVALFIAVPSFSQITLEESSDNKKDPQFTDPIKSTSVLTEYFSQARYKAERAAIRKERNYIEYGGGLHGTLTSYNDAWIATSSGDNSIALIADLYFKHIFTKNLFSIETNVNTKIGYNRIKVETVTDDITSSDGIWFKNQDEFKISIAPSFKLSKNWSYGSIFNFRSQFIRGYTSRTEQMNQHRKSNFMAPGYLDVSLGITYKMPSTKLPFIINVSPIALSAIYVSDKLVRDNNFLYGIEDPDKSSQYEGGSSIQIDFDRTFGKNGIFRYQTKIYSFMGWITNSLKENKYSDYTLFMQKFEEWNNSEDKNIKTKPVLAIHPTVRWENTLSIKATKYLATTLSFQVYYNRAQNPEVQTQTLLSVGLTYTFKNK